jgi:CheY-specific phosphatase CheX
MASLAMIDVATSVELEFAIRASRGSVRALARVMLGLDELDEESALDLLSELCNNLLGQAKTNLQAGGFDFSLATPDRSRPHGIGKAAAAQRAIEVGFPDGILHVALCARIVPPIMVRARELVENMVVVDDIVSPQGALLVPAGTRLTSVTAERVTRYLADREVRVAVG